VAYNLYRTATVQYDDWTGTIAADESDHYKVAELLGVDRDEWFLIAVEIHVWGGSQTITGYAVPRSWTMQALIDEAASTHRVEVTKVVEINFDPHRHADTNPPSPIVLPISSAADLIAIGFKRLEIVLFWKPTDWPDDLEMMVVDDVVERLDDD
jgi:hypothetical protein